MKHSAEPQAFVEPLGGNAEARFSAHRIFAQASAYQTVEVWESPQLGTVFRTDGHSMTASGDEFLYHELLTHPALLRQNAPTRALILGGGDGGSAEEVCKYTSIAHVDIVELDAVVLRMAQDWLPSVHRNVFADPRVRVTVGDARAWVQEARGTAYDLIVFDLTGPASDTANMYGTAFFRQCQQLLTPQGCISLHLGAPTFQSAVHDRVVAELRDCFDFTWFAHLWVPVYAAMRGFAVASRAPLPCHPPVDQLLSERGLAPLLYYNETTDRLHGQIPAYLNSLIRT